MTMRKTIAAIISTTAIAFSITVPAQADEGGELLQLASVTVNDDGDSAVRKRVESALQADPVLENDPIAVETAEGLVRLSGRVDSAEKRLRAQQLVAGVIGVQGVSNELEVISN